MKSKRKRDDHEKVIWLFESPYGYRKSDQLESKKRPRKDGLGVERRRDPSTIDAAHDLFSMANERKIEGIAAVALRKDGSHYLVISGKAMEQNIHASGAVTRLLKLLNSLDEELISTV